MYFIYKLKDILRNILTVVLIVCDVFLINSVNQIIVDRNTSGVIDVYTQEATKNVVALNCLNYDNFEVFIGGDNICFIPIKDGILVEIVNENSKIKKGDYILEVNDVKIKTHNHFLDLIDQSRDCDLKLKIKRKDKVMCETIPYDELVLLNLGIKKDSGNAIVTFYDANTNQFASTGHGVHFFYDKNAQVTTFAYDHIEESSANCIGSLCGDYTDVIIGQTTKNLDSGVYGIITDESQFIDNPKFKLGCKKAVQEDTAMIYCDIDGQGKQWYEVEVISKEALNNEQYFELKMCDENFIEKTGGILSGMSGTPIVQNGEIIGAISKADREDPTIFYGIYVNYMVEDLYNTK